MKRSLLAIGAVLLATLIAGLPYYVLPLGGRVRSPLHDWFRSSGYVGQTLGILAFACFAFLWLYPLRKKFRWLARTGAVPAWLRVHTVAGLSAPFLVCLHAGFRFTGLAGIAFWSMVVVWMSGIVGRYLYSRIPRSRDGLALTLQEIEARREDLVRRIAAVTGMHPSEVREGLALETAPHRKMGVLASLRRMIRDDVARRRTIRHFRHRLSPPQPGTLLVEPKALDEAVRLARQEIALAQQIRLLETTRDLFKFWHVAHRPVAITALVAVLVHVIVVVSVGSTWFR